VLNKLIRDKQSPNVIEDARLQNVHKAGEELNIKDNQQSLIDSFFIESLIRDANKTLAILNELNNKIELNDKDLLKLTITVHGIRSSLQNLGEIALAEMSYKLEMSCREHDTDFITEAIPDFLYNLNELIEKLKAIQDESTIDNPDEDIEELRDKLLSIKKMCAEFDRKGALGIIADIKNCSKKTRAVFDNIMGHMLHSKFDEAQKAAAAYADELASAGQIQ
jgi:HPt (histidine-containing phosphotransfer) domain-containing protein